MECPYKHLSKHVQFVAQIQLVTGCYFTLIMRYISGILNLGWRLFSCMLLVSPKCQVHLHIKGLHAAPCRIIEEPFHNALWRILFFLAMPVSSRELSVCVSRQVCAPTCGYAQCTGIHTDYEWVWLSRSEPSWYVK